jgi:hypothetical protein
VTLRTREDHRRAERARWVFPATNAFSAQPRRAVISLSRMEPRLSRDRPNVRLRTAGRWAASHAHEARRHRGQAATPSAGTSNSAAHLPLPAWFDEPSQQRLPPGTRSRELEALPRLHLLRLRLEYRELWPCGRVAATGTRPSCGPPTGSQPKGDRPVSTYGSSYVPLNGGGPGNTASTTSGCGWSIP